MKKLLFVTFFISFSLFCFSINEEEWVADFYNISSDNREVKTVIIKKGDAIPQELMNVPRYVVGVAIVEKGEIYIFDERTNSYPFGSLEQVLIHELSHIYLYRSIGFKAPRWFDEGLAMKLSGEWSFTDEFYLALSLPKVALSNFELSKLEKDFKGYESSSRTSYTLSRAFVRDLFINDLDLKNFIKDIKNEASFEKAFIKQFNLTPDYAFKMWAKRLPWWGPFLYFLTSANTIWFFIVILFLIASVVTIIRRLKWRKRWEEEENQNDFLQ